MALADRPLFAYAVILGSALVTVSPALSAKPRDSFPLSTFPMFSHGRPDAIIRVEHAVALRGEEELEVPPRHVGSDEVLQASVTLSRAVKRGAAETGSLCRAIADRIVKDGAFAGTTAIEIRSTRRDGVTWFAAVGDDLPPPAPLSVKVHARCAVTP